MADPAVLQQWILSKESGKGARLLVDGTISIEPPRRIFLTQDLNKTSFAVSISRFQPGLGDATAFTWTDAVDGSHRVFDMPPYYISDMAEARENICRYYRQAREEYPNALLVNSNPIVKRTFQEAERYCKASNVSTFCEIGKFLLQSD